MKNLSVTASFSIRSQQSKAALCANKSVPPRRTFKDVGIDSFPAMRIQKAHEVNYGLTSSAHRAVLTDKMPGAVIYRSSISRAHIGFLRLSASLVQCGSAFNEVNEMSVKLHISHY